jgi:hypothetical protein
MSGPVLPKVFLSARVPALILLGSLLGLYDIFVSLTRKTR